MAKKRDRSKPHSVSSRHKEAEQQLLHNWIVLASLAWKGYQENGRGFLVIDELPPERMRYFPLLHQGMAPPPGADKALQIWAEEIETLLHKYDPTKEVVVALWLTGIGDLGGVYNFRLSRKPYPPEAYEQRKAILEGAVKVSPLSEDKQAFLRKSWRELAAYAWKCYGETRRGFILVHKFWSNGDYKASYALVEKNHKPSDTAEAFLHKLVATYDPATSVVFAFQGSPALEVAVIRRAPPPPEAYRKLRPEQ